MLSQGNSKTSFQIDIYRVHFDLSNTAPNGLHRNYRHASVYSIPVPKSCQRLRRNRSPGGDAMLQFTPVGRGDFLASRSLIDLLLSPSLTL